MYVIKKRSASIHGQTKSFFEPTVAFGKDL
jgi:hypothetical protein